MNPGAILVTGATSGIGQATARALAPSARRLLVHGPESAAEVAHVIADLEARLGEGASLAYLQADFGTLAAAGRLADEAHAAADAIGLVINNAARPGSPARVMSGDGNELTLQVNYLAAVALTGRLLERLDAGQRVRVVNVASATHLSATLDLDDLDLDGGYSPVGAYARAKLALVTYTCWLVERLPRERAEVVAVHPGVIATGLLHAMFSVGGDSPQQAARNVVEVASRSGDSGTYYDETDPADPNPIARDGDVQRRLHDLTAARLVAAGVDAP